MSHTYIIYVQWRSPIYLFKTTHEETKWGAATLGLDQIQHLICPAVQRHFSVLTLGLLRTETKETVRHVELFYVGQSVVAGVADFQGQRV